MFISARLVVSRCTPRFQKVQLWVGGNFHGVVYCLGVSAHRQTFTPIFIFNILQNGSDYGALLIVQKASPCRADICKCRSSRMKWPIDRWRTFFGRLVPRILKQRFSPTSLRSESFETLSSGEPQPAAQFRISHPAAHYNVVTSNRSCGSSSGGDTCSLFRKMPQRRAGIIFCYLSCDWVMRICFFDLTLSESSTILKCAAWLAPP